MQPGYFEHYEQVRRKGRQLKNLDGARNAFACASAGKREIEAVTNGVHINGPNHVIPASESSIPIPAMTVQNPPEMPNGKQRRDSTDEANLPRDRMDISLHNFGDYAG